MTTAGRLDDLLIIISLYNAPERTGFGLQSILTAQQEQKKTAFAHFGK
jgi:hypothetical protein